MKRGSHLLCSSPSESSSTCSQYWTGRGATLQELNLQIQTLVSSEHCAPKPPILSRPMKNPGRGLRWDHRDTPHGSGRRVRVASWPRLNLDVATPCICTGHSFSNPHFFSSKMGEIIPPRAVGRIRDEFYEKFLQKNPAALGQTVD